MKKIILLLLLIASCSSREFIPVYNKEVKVTNKEKEYINYLKSLRNTNELTLGGNNIDNSSKTYYSQEEVISQLEEALKSLERKK